MQKKIKNRKPIHCHGDSIALCISISVKTPRRGCVHWWCKTDPPENCHLNVKIMPKLDLFPKTYKKNVIFLWFFKWQVFGNFWHWNGNFPEGQMQGIGTCAIKNLALTFCPNPAYSPEVRLKLASNQSDWPVNGQIWDVLRTVFRVFGLVKP